MTTHVTRLGNECRPLPKPKKAGLSPNMTPADKLIQLLIQKGVLSEEEGRELYQH